MWNPKSGTPANTRKDQGAGREAPAAADPPRLRRVVFRMGYITATGCRTVRLPELCRKLIWLI